MAEAPSLDSPPRSKKVRRQCHYLDTWLNKYRGVTKSRKGKLLLSTILITTAVSVNVSAVMLAGRNL